MSVRSVNAVVWVAVAAVIAMLMAGISSSLGRAGSVCLFFGACGVLIGTVLWYRRAMPAAEAEQQKEYDARVTVLKQELITGKPVAVKSSDRILLFIFLLVLSFAAGLSAFDTPSAKSISLLVVSLAVTFVFSLLVLPVLGKPVLVVMRDGVKTADFGLLKWHDIESIGLRAHSTRGGTSYMLHLYVPGLRQREHQLHPLLRFRRQMLRGAMPDVMLVPLTPSSLPAPVVHKLCYELWKDQTGRTSMQTSAPSKELRDLKRRADEQLAALKKIGATAEHDPSEAMRLLEELEKRFPPTKPQAVRGRRHGRQRARIEAILRKVDKIDPRDVVTRQRTLDTLMKAESRRSMSIGLIVIIVGFAAVMTLFVLFN